MSLSVKYNISQNKIKQYNKDMCFGHRLGHITGKLILIPVTSNAVLTDKIKKQIDMIYQQDNKYNLNDLDEKEYAEPDENGKYQLKKALAYHAKGLDSFRCEYYLKAAKWNVRKALKLWKHDDIWEKKQKVIKECQLNEEEAIILLQNFNWNVTVAIEQRKKYGNNLVLKNMELQHMQQIGSSSNNNNNKNNENQQITLQ